MSNIISLRAHACTPTPRFSLLPFHRAAALWRSRRQLASLTDAQLCDVGLTPSQAHTEAARPLWDAPASWKSPCKY